MVKNNSMNNFMNRSYKYSNNTNLKLVPKTKSLNNFNTNTFKILKKTNYLNNSSSKPIKIKNNNEISFDNQNILQMPKTPEKENDVNNIIQDYNYFKNIYDYQKFNNIDKNNYKNKIDLQRPGTAPHKNKNNKEMIKRRDMNKNNMSFPTNNKNEPLNNYHSCNNNKSLESELIKRQNKNLSNMNMYNKIFKSPGYRPASPMIKPNMRLNKY